MQVLSYPLLNAFFGGCMLILGIQLGLLHVAKEIEWKMLRSSRAYVVLACLVMACVYLSDTFLPPGEKQLVQIIWYGVSCLQAILFTSTCVSFVAPRKQQTRHIILDLSIAFTTLTLALALYFSPWIGEGGKGHIVYFCTLIYAAQLVNDTLYFKRTYKSSLKLLEDTYEDEFSNRLAWVLRLFTTALTVGVAAGCVMLFYSVDLEMMFKCCVIITYSSIVISFVNYQSRALFVVKANRNTAQDSIMPSDNDESKSEETYAFAPEKIAAKLDAWTQRGGHLQADLSVDEIAEQIGLSRNLLTHYFSSTLGTTFRSWRIALRINEAERLIHENPSISTTELMPLCGYNDRSNFHKHFLKQTGLAVNEYKKQFA